MDNIVAVHNKLRELVSRRRWINSHLKKMAKYSFSMLGYDNEDEWKYDVDKNNGAIEFAQELLLELDGQISRLSKIENELNIQQKRHKFEQESRTVLENIVYMSRPLNIPLPKFSELMKENNRLNSMSLQQVCNELAKNGFRWNKKKQSWWLNNV